MNLVAGCLAPLLYCLLALLPILLKWAGAPRFAAWSWWQATALLWGAGGLLALLLLVSWLLDLLAAARRSRGR
jgi:hypothetical protein